MRNSQGLIGYVLPGILAILLLSVYLKTLAPGLTWANDGADGGDLISAAATGGVAHPSGYPLYLLLAGIFQKLPIGSLAYRTNLMSALFAVLAAMLIHRVVVQALAGRDAWSQALAGLAAGLGFGLSPLVWSQAVITEVYSLHAFLVALVLHLVIQPYPHGGSQQVRLDLWRGVAIGLALGNHLSSLLLLPAVGILNALQPGWRKPEADRSGRIQTVSYFLHWRSLFRQLLGLSLALLVYIILPLRALSRPAINWGDPSNFKQFIWLVSGQMYQSSYLRFSLDNLWERLQAWAAFLLTQFGIPGLLVALVGIVIFFRPSRLCLITTYVFAAFTALAILYRSPDSYVYLIPANLSLAVWIGLGVGELTRRTSHLIGRGLAIVFIAYLLGLSAVHLPEVDAARDFRAEKFGRQVLAAVPPRAILIAGGDQAVFTLWYFHFALHERPDLVVVAGDLLQYDWYQAGLQSTYPSLVLTEAFPGPVEWAAGNPSRPVCFVQWNERSAIACQKSKPEQ